MKAAIGCLIGLVFVVGASAEPLLEGQVRLPSGEPVAYAQVQVFDLTDLQRGAVAQATTNGTGYFALSLAALPGLALPERFELGANYPNPFNPATIIPYQLAASSPVRLEVFNLLGQRIATLVEGEQPAGSHTARWQATDAAGRAVGAGVYLYRLTVGEAHQTGRMVLVDGQAGVSAGGIASVLPGASGGGGWSEGERAQEYGLIVSGEGLAPYVDSAFRVEAGMAPVELVVEAHPAGQVLGDDCAFCDLFDVLNDDDEGPGPSGKAQATLAAPAAPTNLRFEAVTDSSCTVRWDAAEGATDYDVNYKPAVGGKWTNEPHRGTGLYNTINDLEPGTEYRWAVRAENGDGSSAWVFGPNFTTLADETDETTEEEAADGQAPAAPTNLRFEAVTDSSCTVRWDAAEGATDYDVNYKPAVGGQWISEPHRGTGLYNTINDLEPGTEYRWAVRAENGDDRSAWVFGPNFTTLPDNQDRLTAGTAMDDRAVLVSLYNTTDGSNWSTSTTWLSDKPIGEWYGVTTDGDGRVVELRLRDNQLSGPIPPELGSLANLRSLDLKDNRLTGEIPARLGNLTNLEMLNLSWNRLFGEIPPELGSLAKLQKLYLGANRIRGGIPPDLGNLTHLRELWLGDGLDLTGEIPLELSRLTQLEVLDLGHSEINGAIPRWLGSMSGLRQLYLDGNEFAGEVPAELGNLTRLELLTLDDNPGLWGVLPEALTAITGLRRLTFHDTGLCAPLDESFQAWLRKVSDRQGLNCLFGSRDRVIIRDMFGRVVNETGIVVVDWEGHIANPAMKYSVELPGPTAILSSTEPRLYFDLPSLAGANGPTKTLASQGLSQATEFRISIFPDRDTSDERHSLTIRYMADQGQIRSQAIDIHVIDQDIDDIDRPPEFNIITDFRYDRRRTRMFDDLVAKATVQQGLDDWAYFIADMNLDEVRAGEEQMWIWDPGGYESGRTVTNAINYTGYLMHVYGHVTGVATGGADVRQ